MDPQSHHAETIERYLQGRLSPAEEEAFEEAYLADPALLRELQLAERLREGLRDAAGEQASSVPPRRGWLDVAASPRYGIAASLLAVAALATTVLMYAENRSLRIPAPTAVAASGMRLLPLVTVRGGGDANVIPAQTGDEWTVLMLDAGFTDYAHYRAVLVRRDAGAEHEIVRVDALRPTYEGYLALGVPSRLLAPGAYEVRLQGARPGSSELDDLGRTPLTVAP
jgi:hypothetical protein